MEGLSNKQEDALSDTEAPAAENPIPVKMKKYATMDISPGHFFSEPVFLDRQFLLAAPEMPFTAEMLKALKDWEFTDVYSAGDQMEDYAAKDTNEEESVELSGVSSISDGDKILQAERFYADFLKYVESTFIQAALKDELNFNHVAERIRAACDIIKEDRRFLLRVQKNSLASPTDNYMASHAVKSTIISIIIGLFLKLPNYRLIELGVAALLHEIGMIKLPSNVYLSKRALEPKEQKLIFSHPVLSFNLLKSFGFPLSVSMAALEHHERENGSGYPRQLKGERISLYAKIIAVACSYEALSSQRPHKEAKDGFTGMLELLKNEGKQYDDTVVRALVFSLSIYPIGLYVLLSSGRKGQVVDVNPENPRFPIVQIFGELTPDGKNKVLETSQDGIYILRPLTREEIG
jgi:HD-GYP domain-containing protein (c-di-GMP phosphodiesterase class II)